MTLDDDLRLSCICGCTTIQIRGGYSTQTIRDVEELGLAATTLCRRKRYRRVLWRWLIVACLAGVAGMAWVDGANRARTEEAGRLCREGERKLNVDKDDPGAIDSFTKSLALKPDARVYLFRCFAHYRMCDYSKAISDCDSALAIDPSNNAAIKNRRMIMDASRKAARAGFAVAGE